ncbi:hypothetical protein MAH4_30270 [Sessilibacter sp. MAH4]
MIGFMRFSHVGEIINHNANSLNDKEILLLINTFLQTGDDAYAFCKYAYFTRMTVAETFSWN